MNRRFSTWRVVLIGLFIAGIVAAPFAYIALRGKMRRDAARENLQNIGDAILRHEHREPTATPAPPDTDSATRAEEVGALETTSP